MKHCFTLLLYRHSSSHQLVVADGDRADVVDPRDADSAGLSSPASCSIAKQGLNSVTGKICLDRLDRSLSDWF